MERRLRPVYLSNATRGTQLSQAKTKETERSRVAINAIGVRARARTRSAVHVNVTPINYLIGFVNWGLGKTKGHTRRMTQLVPQAGRDASNKRSRIESASDRDAM